MLLEATTVYADQTNIIDWGKVDYAPGENGGISGVAIYATTRAEDDPQNAATDPWEPGIPRVQFNLYADSDSDGIIDDADGNGKIELADVDNYPFGWAQGGKKGPEDINRTGGNGFRPRRCPEYRDLRQLGRQHANRLPGTHTVCHRPADQGMRGDAADLEHGEAGGLRRRLGLRCLLPLRSGYL